MPSRTKTRPGHVYWGLYRNNTIQIQAASSDIERGQHRIAQRLVRPRRIRPLEAQHKQPHDGENVKDQHREDDVVQQLAVGAGDAQHDGPRGLHQQARRGRLVARMQLADGLEEQAVLAHGVVDARPGQRHSVGAAEGGDQNRRGHQVRAAGVEDLLQHRRGHAILRRILNAARHHRGAVAGRHAWATPAGSPARPENRPSAQIPCPEPARAECCAWDSSPRRR